MNLVNEVDLVPTLSRCILDVIQDFAGIVDPGSRCGIDFDEINEPSFVYALTGAALTTRLGLWALFAVHRLGEDPRERRLAHTSGPAEEKRVVHPILLDRVAQGIDHVVLPNDIGKTARPPLAGKRLITHNGKTGVMAR